MAHQLDNSIGKIAFAYNTAGGLPWHGLGTPVDGTMLANDVLGIAGIDFDVVKSPLVADVGGTPVPVPGKFATVRTDTNAVLGVVGNGYHILQNRDAVTLLDEVAGSDRLIEYETAGGLFNGATIFLCARLTNLTIAPVAGDETLPYLVLANSHDGSGTLRIFFTTVRVVCNNTLTLAKTEAGGGGVVARHTKNMTVKLGEAQRILGLARQKFTNYGEDARRLALTQMGDVAFRSFLDNLFPIPQDAEESTRAKNRKEMIANLFESGMGTEIAGVRGTAWGALNAVTEYVDHHATVKNGNTEAHFDSAILGGPKTDLKRKALDLLLA